ncbi:MAG: hypothetical protein H6737_16665 [Alphaproteobacteria bacterium]|nr:hypothetical protein [Alphaproteobacteria bacterium]
MSNASTTLDRATSSRVDAALRNWRSETVERRAAWDAGQAEIQAEQSVRRKRTALFSAMAAGVFATTFAIGFTLTSLLVPPTAAAAIAPTVAPAIPAIGTAGTIPAPETVQPVAATSALASDLGILGEVQSWTRNDTLWVQLDYSGAALVLKWADSTGAEVMERTPCMNAVAAGVRRCYVGRTARRVELAREAGAQPGTWSASACRGDVCRTVATWLVE